MSKNSSAKYYQDNKERLQKKVREKYQNNFLNVFLNNEKTKKATKWL